MELHGEKLAGEVGSEDLGLWGESVVRDDGETGDTAQEIPHSEAGEERSAVVVQPPRPSQHYQGQAVTQGT